MNFNFKNKNTIIILLLILLIASVFCFFLMQKKVEPFIQETDHYTNNVFYDLGNNLNYNKHLYKLDDRNKGYQLKSSLGAYSGYKSDDISFITNTNENKILDSTL